MGLNCLYARASGLEVLFSDILIFSLSTASHGVRCLLTFLRHYIHLPENVTAIVVVTLRHGHGDLTGSGQTVTWSIERRKSGVLSGPRRGA